MENIATNLQPEPEVGRWTTDDPVLDLFVAYAEWRVLDQATASLDRSLLPIGCRQTIARTVERFAHLVETIQIEDYRAFRELRDDYFGTRRKPVAQPSRPVRGETGTSTA